jgi:hypothetical protein
MTGSSSVLMAGNSFGLVVAFLSCMFIPIHLFSSNFLCDRIFIVASFKYAKYGSITDWAGCAGLWGGGITPINLPTFAMYKQD